jgi:plasmid stabilization system protein ParE
VWAQADRGAIFDYIEADNPRAAVAIDMRISDRVRLLARLPRQWSPRPRRRHTRVGHYPHAVYRGLPDYWGYRAHSPRSAQLAAMARRHAGRIINSLRPPLGKAALI